jgi:hypothetical protein
MKNITAFRMGVGQVEFKFTKTALIGVGSNHYAATRAQFRKLFRQREGAALNLFASIAFGLVHGFTEG